MRAFGYCFDTLDPQDPDRLCRGRERWIEPIVDPADDRPDRVHRLVISGANFSDDSARDAVRGLAEAGVTAAVLIRTIFPDLPVHAFREVGDPRALPPVMLTEEDWTYTPQGGARRTPAVRWLAPIGVDEADVYMLGEDAGMARPKADGFLVGADVSPEDLPALEDALFKLVGFSDPDGRPALFYNAMGIPAVLEHCEALVLFHLDKHGPAFIVYTFDPLDVEPLLLDVARAGGTFAVPFSIPPMLARWDRALYELRMQWDDANGPFPVPPAEDAGGRWSTRRRHAERIDDAATPSEGTEEAGGEE
jgi:hypothetical protein